jgi:hypothetical protein
VDLIKAVDIVIEKPQTGKIEFGKNELNLVDKDLNEFIKIEKNRVEVDSDIAPGLNKSAVVVLYDIDIEDPIILKDGVYCDECKVISYGGGEFIFYVPHFTTYSLLALASYSGYCGDGLCSIYESCSDCREDCGECSGEPGAPMQCEEMWVCSGWSECNEHDLRTRECMDVNLCGTGGKKPAETMACGGEADTFSFLAFGLVIMILVMAYLASETYRKRRENKKMDKFELENFIKGHMYRGYSRDEITKILTEKGYDPNEIQKAMKTIEKETF